MFFTNNDIIELKDKNYIVQKVALIENEAYYEVQEIEKDTNELLYDKLIVKAVNDNSTLFIEEVHDHKLLEIIYAKLK